MSGDIQEKLMAHNILLSYYYVHIVVCICRYFHFPDGNRCSHANWQQQQKKQIKNYKLHHFWLLAHKQNIRKGVLQRICSLLYDVNVGQMSLVWLGFIRILS